jgi:type 2A phosphatase activator TIP41
VICATSLIFSTKTISRQPSAVRAHQLHFSAVQQHKQLLLTQQALPNSPAAAAAAAAKAAAGIHSKMEPLARASRVHEESYSVKGWTVRARTAPIIGSTLMDQYSEQLGGVLTIPEICFGNSSLQLRHDASGVVLSFNALDALKQWKADDLPPLKVNVAREWQAARLHEIEKQQAVVLEYDWTYTTSYSGSLSWSPPQFGSSSDSSSAAGTRQQPQDAAASPAAAAAADCNASDSNPTQQQQQQQQQQQLPQWQPSSRQIDRRMLMSKDEPILFYAEVPLYESELDDNGVCQLTVKVRPHELSCRTVA